MPGIFPDYMAPVVRNAPNGVRELAMLRWGMPGPPQFGGAPITNIRNAKSVNRKLVSTTEHLRVQVHKLEVWHRRDYLRVRHDCVL
jgi:putative SOS response-associated peptidase YedK